MVLRYTLQETRVIGLRNAIAYPHSGAVVSSQGQVILESLGSLYKAMTYSGFVAEAARYRWSVDRRKEKLIVPGIGGFYHWMFECLPSVIRCLERYPDHRILLPIKRPAFIDAFLAIILGVGWRAKALFSSRPLRAQEAVFYSKSYGAQFVHPDDVELLRKRLLPNLLSGKRPGKVFISRRQAKARACEEGLIASAFRSRGFAIVELETLPLTEQIALLAGASHVAGFHGAGFSHGIFIPDGCRVLELFRHDGLNDCYARLFKTLGRDYRFFVSQAPYPNRFPALEAKLDTWLSVVS
jgi:capsular polysaccharide biosynthesis protein